MRTSVDNVRAVRNRTGLLVRPWAVVAPALLVVALTRGSDLLVDAATEHRTPPGRGTSGRTPLRKGRRP